MTYCTQDTKSRDESCIFVTFDKQATATLDMFVHVSRDSVSLSHAHTYTPSRFGSVCVNVWVCACVYDKPHWWSNSRLAVFPDWAALDMHTSKALQVDVLALQHCNSLAWLTQNTLGTEKQNPDSSQCYIKTKKNLSNSLRCMSVFTHLFACMHHLSVCVFKQDTNIDCSLIILPSALFKALINSLILERHAVDTERKDEVVGWRCNTFYGWRQ